MASFKQRNSAITDVATAGVDEGGGDRSTATDPEGGRGSASSYVGDGASEVATTRTCVTTCV